ncbi:MAG TPA: sialidase family protein [Candidatus Limnocylindrales bacterium]|nr:sialidase family protein [Candidatus Limnocylindrales bacterium]
MKRHCRQRSARRLLRTLVIFASVMAASPNAAVAQPFEAIVSLNSYANGDDADDGAVAIATDGRGRWVAVWETLHALGRKTPERRWNIAFSVSTDDGRSWSAAALLAPGRSAGATMDTSPAIATDRRGVWVVAFQSAGVVKGSPGSDSDVLWARSDDDGASWSAPQPVALDAGDEFRPALAFAGNAWLLGWEGQARELGGGGDGDLVVSRSTDGARTWSAPALLTETAKNDAGVDRRLVLAVEGAGERVLAGWEAFSVPGLGSDWDVMVARSDDAGASWSAAQPLSARAASDGHAGDDSVSLAAAGDGRWLALWASYVGKPGDEEDDWDIMAAASSDGGKTWSSAASVNGPFKTDTHRDLLPRVAFDGAGRFVAVWTSKDSMGKTKGSDSDVLVSVSTDDGRTWSPPRAVAAYATADGRSWDDKPVVVSDGKGLVLVAWSGNHNLEGRTGTDGDLRVVGLPKAPPATASAPAPPLAIPR